MITILFVCTGNTCRSPMAAVIAQFLLDKLVGEGVFQCISAGINCVEDKINSNVAPALQVHGCDTKVRSESTQQINQKLLDDADIVFCLGRNIQESLVQEFSACKDKVFLFNPSVEKVRDPHDLDQYSTEDKDKYYLSPQGFFGYTLIAKEMMKYIPTLFERPEFKALGKDISKKPDTKIHANNFPVVSLDDLDMLGVMGDPKM